MKSILFKPWKIKAIAESSPTFEWQTRRLSGLKEINKEPDRWHLCGDATRVIPPVRLGDSLFQHADGHCIVVKPRYRVGDIGYIKEAHYAYGHWILQFVGDNGKARWEFCRDKNMVVQFPDVAWEHALIKPGTKEGWYKRSPLFLLAEDARNFIKVTGVSDERLQILTEADAIAEGIMAKALLSRGMEVISLPSYINTFAMLWDSINPEYPWSGNWWVAVYSFVKWEKPI